MAESSNRFITLDNSGIEDYIQEQQNKNTQTENRPGVSCLANYLNRRNTQEKLKKSNQMNSTTTYANLL